MTSCSTPTAGGPPGIDLDRVDRIRVGARVGAHVGAPVGAHVGTRARAWGRRAATGLLGASGLALLAACSGTLLPKPALPPARFTLDGAGSAAASATASAVAAQATLPASTHVAASVSASTLALVVAMPRAAPGYESRRMVYLRQPHELEAFAFHEWVEAPAQMLAPLLVRALQDSASFRAVLLAPSSAVGAWRLETDLLRLQQDFSSQPSHVRLTLRAVLLDTATRSVLAWREFDITVAAKGDDPVSGVRAAHQATQSALAALAAFCAEQARAAETHRVRASVCQRTDARCTGL